MAKKALLGEDYNPVGSRLQRVTSADEDQEDGRKEERESADASTRSRAFVEKEALTVELRCRCTRFERKKWHRLAQELTGEPNRFSNFMRAMLLLLEHADPQLQKLQHRIEQLRIPPKNDTMAMALYEQQLAEIIWEAFRRSGKPAF